VGKGEAPKAAPIGGVSPSFARRGARFCRWQARRHGTPRLGRRCAQHARARTAAWRPSENSVERARHERPGDRAAGRQPCGNSSGEPQLNDRRAHISMPVMTIEGATRTSCPLSKNDQLRLSDRVGRKAAVGFGSCRGRLWGQGTNPLSREDVRVTVGALPAAVMRRRAVKPRSGVHPRMSLMIRKIVDGILADTLASVLAIKSGRKLLNESLQYGEQAMTDGTTVRCASRCATRHCGQRTVTSAAAAPKCILPLWCRQSFRHQNRIRIEWRACADPHAPLRSRDQERSLAAVGDPVSPADRPARQIFPGCPLRMVDRSHSDNLGTQTPGIDSRESGRFLRRDGGRRGLRRGSRVYSQNIGSIRGRHGCCR
jgi:hypothetical protein